MLLLRQLPGFARYVFDGLLHHQRITSLPQQQVHSTDTHGVSLINFALDFLLDIDFQPRIEGFHKCKLHGIADMPILQQLDYSIRADKNINTGLIELQWDNILRFVVSLKPHRRPCPVCAAFDLTETTQFIRLSTPTVSGIGGVRQSGTHDFSA